MKKTEEEKVYLREHYKAKKEEHLKAGLCRVCDNPVVEGRTSCEYHLRHNKELAKQRRERLKNSGLCKSCYSNPPVTGRNYCAKCLEYRNQWMKNRRAHMRSNGLCYVCGEPTNNGNAYCVKCQGFGHKGSHSSNGESIRGQAIIRDKYRCVICGSEKFIMVHHVGGDGYNKKKDNLPNNDLDNLITVCRKCHRYIHALSNRLKKIPHSTEILQYALRL